MSRELHAPAAPARGGSVPLATAGLLIGMLLSVLDQTVVAIALPDMAADLGGMDAIGWVVTSYVLASTTTGALYGRLSDRFGRRDVFVAAIVVFLAGSALCGAAQSVPHLVAARTLQGIGAGALFVLPTIALSELYPERLRSRIQGFTGGIFALAAVGGPLAGGVITDTAGWRWIFYINVPLGLLSAALVVYALRLPKAGGGNGIDLAGSVLIAGAVVSLLLVAEWGGRAHAWTSGTILALAGAFAVLVAIFVWWEGRAADPLLPPRLFANPVLRVALPATALLGALLGGSIVYLPTYLRNAYDMSATQAGLALNPYVIPFIAVSALAGARIGASGRFKPYLLAGSAVVALGFALLSRLEPGTAYTVLAVELGVLGVGFGLMMQNLVVVAQNAATPADLAAATSAAVSVRGLGMSLGVAIFGNLLTRELQAQPPTPEATAAAIPAVLTWGIPAALALLALVALLPASRTDSRSPASTVRGAGRQGDPRRPVPPRPARNAAPSPPPASDPTEPPTGDRSTAR